jgi:hypothetical protein
MINDDLSAHLEDMAKTFERLSSLVTSEAPLTPNDIYSLSILTSLPTDWLACVSSMMNEPRVDPNRVIDALKAEELRRKTRSSDQPIVESVSQASNKKPSKSKSAKQDQPTRHCTFCNLDGHDLNRCFNVARLIENHKSNQAPPKNKKDGTNRPPPSSNASTYPAKAGRTSAALLGSSNHKSDGESDFSGSELEITAGQAAVSLSSSSLPTIPSGDANLDSGCSISMTPDLNAVSSAKPNKTPVRLADHSSVEASHKGVSRLPLKGGMSVPTLVVPALAEPLISIAGLCDAGLTAVFTPTSCDIYSTGDMKVSGSLVGRGYRRGNLFYLPSQPVGHLSSSFTLDNKVDNTLLGYH